MDQEQLIRQIMAEVMSSLDKEQVTFAKPSASAPASGSIGVAQYPLAEKHPRWSRRTTASSWPT